MAVPKILADTSTWILYLRPGCPPAHYAVFRQRLLANELVISEPIMLELLQGEKTASRYHDLFDRLQALERLSVDRHVWERCYDLNFQLNRKGVIVAPMDRLIAAVALSYDAHLWSLDHHFRLIANHTDLQLFKSIS